MKRDDVTHSEKIMESVECPDCGCQKFYVKNPDDPYELYVFDCESGRLVFEDETVDVDDDTETYCDRCAWHGRYGTLKPTNK